MEYASIAWCGLSFTASARLERVQRRAARLISNISLSSDVPNDIILALAVLQSLEARCRIEQAVFAFRFFHGGSLPSHLKSGLAHWLKDKPPAASSLCNASHSRLPRPRQNALKFSPLYMCLSLWNSLSPAAQASKSPRGLISLLTLSG